MASFAQRHLDQLKTLSKSKKKNKIVKKSPNSLIKALCECCKNLMTGSIPISKQRLHRLRPYKKILRSLANKKVPLFKKRRILVQRGDGLLSILIPAALSVLSSFIHGT